jgi:GMP synthase PP-ATPase subunit
MFVIGTAMPGRQRKRIKKTTCEGIRNVLAENQHMKFTADGTLMGDQVNQFCNYISMIVRDREPCNLPDWKASRKLIKILRT